MSFLFLRMFHFPVHKAIRVPFKGLQAGARAKTDSLTLIVRAGVFLGVGQFSATGRQDNWFRYSIHVRNYKATHSQVFLSFIIFDR